MRALRTRQLADEDIAEIYPALPNSALPAPLSGVVAIVGCDGTGKSTLVRDLVMTLNRERPTVRRYMGLVSGETGDKIKELPLSAVGSNHLARKVRRAQDMKKKLPGTFSAIVMYLFSVWRVFQLNRLKRLSQRGMLVIADRFPQNEVPGFHYDGPGLSAERTTNRLVRALAVREQRLYDRMAEIRPSLIIRLNIDPETAYARKPDHPIAELRDKIAIMPNIGYNGSAMCEIDARRPYASVLEMALQAIGVFVIATSL